MHQETWVPIAFFSRILTTAEQKYSAFDRELLAAYSAIRHFLEAKQFTLYTDHKPLIFALSSTTERSPRLTRHLSFIAEFSSDIQYIKDKHNVVADTLSRINATLFPDLDFTALAADQATSVKIKAYRTAVSNLSLEDITFENFSLLCDVSQGYPRPILPREWTYRAF